MTLIDAPVPTGAPPQDPVNHSIVAPVPEAHLSFIEQLAALSPVFSLGLKMIIFASCPPSSTTEPTSGWSSSTAMVTALTSCTNLAPICGAIGPPPDPVMNTRISSWLTWGNAASISVNMERTNSGWRVSWR